MVCKIRRIMYKLVRIVFIWIYYGRCVRQRRRIITTAIFSTLEESSSKLAAYWLDVGGRTLHQLKLSIHFQIGFCCYFITNIYEINLQRVSNQNLVFNQWHAKDRYVLFVIIVRYFPINVMRGPSLETNIGAA